MRAHRSRPPGLLLAGMIFLFITAFDPWPTEARAAVSAGSETCCLALSTGRQAGGALPPQAWISADSPNSLASLVASTQPSTSTVRP